MQKEFADLKMNIMNILSRDDVFSRLEKLNPRRQYHAMYSTLYDGFVTDPALMLVPLDDHLVHRGDGVFEAIRATPLGFYLLDQHLDRLFRSAESLALPIPLQRDKLRDMCGALLDMTSHIQNRLLRIFVGRGPGDFSPNPYSTLGSQLYAVMTDFKPFAPAAYSEGTSLMISQVPVKPGMYSQVKSCNYLPNVMMKKEAIDHGYDFAVSLNENDFITEGPTENMMIVTRENELLAPRFDYTLRGTTLLRAMELAINLKKSGHTVLKDIRLADLKKEDLCMAREIMMVGTTMAVLPVTRFEKSPVADGRPGPVAQKLCELILRDMGY